MVLLGQNVLMSTYSDMSMESWALALRPDISE